MEFIEVGNPEVETRAAVNELIEAFTHSWASQDVEAHMALFSEDAEWINAYARMFRGKDELSVFLEQRLFPNWPIKVSQQEMANAKMISVRYLGDDAAVIHIATDGERGPSTISDETMRRTHLHLVAEERGGDWLIVHVAIMDARE
ncbi:MAG: SgcJ/EcaC family oxidoreductase [Pseudomonadales bacterium]|nr:SgcJ/EcaC family oxidoreductase [Pseudomonadales bacterium]